MFIGNILSPGIVLYEAAAIVKHIASGGEVAALIDADIPPVSLIVDVVDQMLRHFHTAELQHIHTAQLLVTMDIRIELKTIQIMREVDQISHAGSMFAAVNDCLEFLQIALIHFRQQNCQIVELVQIFILAQMLMQPQHIPVEVGNEDLLIPHPIHADAFQKGLYLLGCSGKFQIFAYQLTLVVFPQVGDIGFKQGGHISAAPVP